MKIKINVTCNSLNPDVLVCAQYTRANERAKRKSVHDGSIVHGIVCLHVTHKTVKIE